MPIKELMDQLQEELGKFYVKGNKAAGTRARVMIQVIKRELDSADPAVRQAAKNALAMLGSG